MSDDDRKTLIDELATKPDHEVPSVPPLTPQADDSDLEGAPSWAFGIARRLEAHHDEVREAMIASSEAMVEIANLGERMTEQYREIKLNLGSLCQAFDNLRDEMRSRVGAHDGEIKDLREQLAALEKKLAEALRQLAMLMAERQATSD